MIAIIVSLAAAGGLVAWIVKDMINWDEPAVLYTPRLFTPVGLSRLELIRRTSEVLRADRRRANGRR